MLELTLVNGCPSKDLLRRINNDTFDADADPQLRQHLATCDKCEDFFEQLRDEDNSLISPVLQTASSVDAPPQLDAYQVVERLGEGGMGVVWLVNDLRMQRQVALKVLKRSVIRDVPGAVGRFQREALITARVAHPNIVPVYGNDDLSDGRPYFLMKYVKGQTLAEMLHNRHESASRVNDLLPYFEHICQAVAHAHDKDVIHRDLKPKNVMVGEQGEVVVMDWGLAKDRDAYLTGCEDGSGPPGTSDAEGLGTLPYMPPEQIGGRTLDIGRRSDVFGLGAILCEILTGKPPYTGETKEELIEQVRCGLLEDAYTRLRGCGQDRELIALALKCLAAEPQQRFRDAGVVARRVKAYRNSAEERLHRQREEQAVQTATLHSERRGRKLRLALAVASFLALAATAGGGVVWVKGHLDLQHQEDVHEREKNHQRDILGRDVKQILERGWERLIDRDVQRARDLRRLAWDRLKPGETPALRALYDEFDRAVKLVEELDRIRQFALTWTNGAFDCATALDQYQAAFASAGLDPLKGDLTQMANKISRSRIRVRLLAALDDYALLSERERKKAGKDQDTEDKYRRQRNRLLALAQKAEPEKDFAYRLRDSRTWDSPEELRAIAFGMNPKPYTPELLILVGELLERPKRAAFWKRCLASHPTDFWLNVELGTFLMRQLTRDLEVTSPSTGLPHTPERQAWGVRVLAGEAVGHYRAALMRDPEAPGVRLDLMAALTFAGDSREAIDHGLLFTQEDATNAEGHDQLGLAYCARREWAKALGCFERAGELAKPNEVVHCLARWHEAEMLIRLKQPEKGIERLREALKLAEQQNDLINTTKMRKRLAELQPPKQATPAAKPKDPRAPAPRS